jgi:hypothetical protein
VLHDADCFVIILWLKTFLRAPNSTKSRMRQECLSLDFIHQFILNLKLYNNGLYVFSKCVLFYRAYVNDLVIHFEVNCRM